MELNVEDRRTRSGIRLVEGECAGVNPEEERRCSKIRENPWN